MKTLFIEPSSPWENGYNESFNGKLRDELLDSEIFYTLKEAKVLIERWRQHYNTIRAHSTLGYKPPAPEPSCHALLSRLTLCSCLKSRAKIRAKLPHRRWTTSWGQVTLEERIKIKS